MYLVFQLPAPKKYLGAELDVAPLAQVFDDTSATYKYWWLSALLQLHHDKMVKTLTAKPRPERRKRDLEELNNEIKRANKAVASGELMGNPYASGWRSLIATEKERAEGENKAKYRAVGLKEDVIKARRDVAGYYAVVFDHPEGISADNTLADEEVLSTYHRLVRIEECFRIMKSRFSIRPVYVWKAARITGHCYLCVLALMLLRELQFKLEDHGVHMSVDRICDALRQAAVGVSGDGTFKPQSRISDTC